MNSDGTEGTDPRSGDIWAALGRVREACRPWIEEERVREVAAHAWATSDGGVRFERTTLACPQQLEGVVDGVEFYFRERWDMWSLEVRDASAGGTACDTSGDSGEPVLTPSDDWVVIGEGTFDAYTDVVALVQTITRDVRDWVRRRDCAHRFNGRFCGDCGQRLHP